MNANRPTYQELLNQVTELKTINNSLKQEFIRQAKEKEKREADLIKINQKLKESEKNYKHIFESTGTANSIFDRHCILILQNNLSIEFLGVGKKGGIGLSVFELFGKEVGRSVYERMNRVINSGTSEVFETEFNLHSGKNWFRSTYQPVFDENKQVISVQVISQNITEIKIAELELIKAKERAEESEKNFRQLVWDMQVGVLLQGPKTEMLLCNPEALELLGLSEEQLLGKSSFDPDWNVIHEDGSPFPGPEHPVPVAIAERRIVRNVIMGVYRPASKSRVWLLVDAIPQFNENGTVKQVVCTFINITSRKEAEFQLKEKSDEIEAQNEELQQANEELNYAKEKAVESEEHHRLITNNLPVLISHINSDLKFLLVNDMYNEILGMNPGYIVGKNVKTILGKETLTHAYPNYLKVLGGKYVSFENTIIDKNGRKRLFQTTYIPHFEGENVHDFFVLEWDITEQKLAEAALKESEEKFKRFFEDDLTGDFIIDEQGILKDCNKSFLEIFGYKNKGDLVGKTITVLYQDPSEFETNKELLKRTRKLTNFEVLRKHKNGSAINIIENKVASFNAKGEIEEIKGYVNDITKRKQDELLILQQTSELKNLNADKDRFISILAHDLKGPFTTILGFLDLLVQNIRKYDSDKIEKQLKIINNSARNTFKLLEDLLMWARIQSGKFPFKPENLNFKNLCNEITEIYTPIASNKNITINHFEENDINIFADVNMLNTVLRNLISNAIKFSTPGGCININALQSQTHITISVSDNGVGIPRESLARLFDISQKNSTEGTANEKGTGLGLLLCKEFIEKHGGKIWVESEFRKGSTFYFTIPVNESNKVV